MIYGIYAYPIPAQEISMSKQRHDFFSTRKQFCFLQCSQTHGDYYATDILNWTSATYSSIAAVQFGLTFSNNGPFDHHIFTIKIPAIQTLLLRLVMIEIISIKKIHYELLYLTRKLVTTPNIWEMLRRVLEVHFLSPNVAEILQRQKNYTVRLHIITPLWFLRSLSSVCKTCQPTESTQVPLFTSGFVLIFHGINSKNVHRPWAWKPTCSCLTCRVTRQNWQTSRWGHMKGRVLFLPSWLSLLLGLMCHFLQSLLNQTALKIEGTKQNVGPLCTEELLSQECYNDPSEAVIKTPNKRLLWAYNEWCLYTDLFCCVLLAYTYKRCRSFILFCSFQFKLQNEVHAVTGMSPFH